MPMLSNANAKQLQMLSNTKTMPNNAKTMPSNAKTILINAKQC